MRTAASRLGSVLRAARSTSTRSFAAEAAPAVSSDIGYVAQVNADVLHACRCCPKLIVQRRDQVVVGSGFECIHHLQGRSRHSATMFAGHRPCRGRALRWGAPRHHELPGGAWEESVYLLGLQ